MKKWELVKGWPIGGVALLSLGFFASVLYAAVVVALMIGTLRLPSASCRLITLCAIFCGSALLYSKLVDYTRGLLKLETVDGRDNVRPASKLILGAALCLLGGADIALGFRGPVAIFQILGGVAILLSGAWILWKRFAQ